MIRMASSERPFPIPVFRDFPEPDCLIFSLWIGGISHERDSLIKLKRRVKRWSFDIQAEDLGTRLVADEQKIFESS